MLGIRLKPEEEDQLARHARDAGRPKSVIARDWIRERLNRESTDALVAAAAARINAYEREHGTDHPSRIDSIMAALDAEDGGYDWGPDGPPQE